MNKNELFNLNEMYKRIEDLCKNKGVNITQMCKEANVARGGLTDLKYNRSTELSSKSLSRLSVYFGVSMDYLLGNEQKNPATDTDSGISKEKAEFIEKIKQMSDEQFANFLFALRIVEATQSTK